MITRRQTNPANQPSHVEDNTVEIKVAVSESDGRKLDAIADDLEISINTLLHEGVAELLAKHGHALPASLVEHLEAHGQPLPPGAKRAPKTYRFH